MTEPATPEAEPKPRPRVTIDAEVWSAIDRLLLDLPYRTTAPIANAIAEHGGVTPA